MQILHVKELEDSDAINKVHCVRLSACISMSSCQVQSVVLWLL